MRAGLTARRDRLARPFLWAVALLLLLAALAGCAGGQSGSEGCTDPKIFDTRIATEADEDGGVEDLDAGEDTDGGDGSTAFVASNPEQQDAPRQCVPPER